MEDREVDCISVEAVKNNVNASLTNDEITLNGENELTEKQLEQENFQRIVNSFRGYKLHSLKRLNRSTNYIKSLPLHQQKLLRNYQSHLDQVRVAIEHNYEIIKLITKDVGFIFENADHSSVQGLSTVVSSFDIEKVQSVLKQIYREWSLEGREERNLCYKPIIDEMLLRFPASEVKRHAIQVLVPGSGLGRLSYEIAKNGFSCQGNEYSLFMLFASNFVLNKCEGKNLYRLYPWVHQYCNNMRSRDQVQVINFPDVDPHDLPSNIEFSMAAGNFIEIYKTPENVDCIATCFFLDTAQNVIDYIETAWKILKSGGFWINMGPLLYHHADIPHENSIEPGYDDIREIMVKIGFNFLREDLGIPTTYSQNPNAMMSYQYKCAFFVCQKPHLVKCISR